MKNVIFKNTSSGLNSNRLILNAVVDIMEGKDFGGIVEISNEMSLEDVDHLIKDGLTYRVNSGLMSSVSLSGDYDQDFLQAFIS